MVKIAKIIHGADNSAFIVDDKNYDWLKQYKWRDRSDGYAMAYVEGEPMTMHRLVMGDPDGIIIDHKNRMVNDNRESNLRHSNHSLNQANKRKSENKSTKYKGVVKRPYGSYEVNIKKDGVYTYLGMFTDKIAAASCYNHHAVKLFGEHARVNNVEEMSQDEWASYKSIRKPNMSEYKGVSWDSRSKAWRVRVNHKGKTIEFGKYRNENAAANRYNIEVKKIKGNQAIINDVSLMEEGDIESYRLIRTKTSKYTGVKRTPSGKYGARIYHHGQQMNLGTYVKEEEAAQAYNEYIVLHNIDRELNIID